MADQITISINEAEDAYLYHLIKQFKIKDLKGYILESLQLYIDLCAPESGDSIDMDDLFSYKEKLIEKNDLDHLKKERDRIVRSILNCCSIISMTDADIGLSFDSRCRKCSFGEGNSFAEIVVYNSRLHVIDALIKKMESEGSLS